MAKNIMLIFLSDIKPKSETIISDTKYTNISGENTHTTNESAIRYVLQNGTPTLDKIFIIASKMVRENEIATRDGKKFLLDDKPIKHLDYFKLRMKNFLPNIDTCIDDKTVYPYDEKNSKNLKSVAEMAGRIQNYSAQIDDEVILHVDFSGGMRHINMMMLDVIRLLEYSGITIGKLLYSNYNFDTKTGTVEEVKDIYDMFQLISGVEEFVQFGSVKALKKYYEVYKDNLSTPLKNLINAMENFSEAIKLCHYGQFRESIENLHDAVNDFESDSENVQDILMARLIGRIKKDYEQLIKTRELDDLRVIRWCIDNGYMQQALTLYTERVPEYLGQKNFVTVPLSQSHDLEEARRNDKRNFYFYLLNNYAGNEDDVNNAINLLNDELFRISKKYIGLLKDDAINAINKRKFNFDSWIKRARALSTNPFIKLSDESKLKSQLGLLVELKDDPFLLMNLSNEELEPIKPIFEKRRSELGEITDPSRRYRKILEYIRQITLKDLSKYFPVFERQIQMQIFRLKVMIDGGIFNAEVPVETFLSIMDKYFKIKAERNQSNHAREDYVGEFPTAEALKEFMTAGLDEIEDAKKFLKDEV